MRTASTSGGLLSGALCAALLSGCSIFGFGSSSPCDSLGCRAPATCQVTGKTAACVCASPDLVLTSDKLGCMKDPCAGTDTMCDMNATCDGSTGVAICTCNAGFTGGGRACSDIDECTNGTADCNYPSGATCTNTPGSYQCTCPSGFEGDGTVSGTGCTSVDLCGKNPGLCGSGTCTDTAGSYFCNCPQGYQFDTTKGTCADIDECNLQIAQCSQYATCSNTPGSYTCECMMGYTGNGFDCQPQNLCNSEASSLCDLTTTTCVSTGPGMAACQCLPGYQPLQGSTSACTRIDACGANPPPACPNNSTCTDTLGSYTCNCNSGFVLQNDQSCKSQFCELGLAQCDTNATCADTANSYSCTCNPGFTGSGKTCADINECATGMNNCAANATCLNTFGSYECACPNGFVGNGFSTSTAGGTGCTVQDQCKAKVTPCAEFASCSDTTGSVQCTCLQGYTGDGFTCMQIDYCGLGMANCDPNATCSDVPGSYDTTGSYNPATYSCSCNPGYGGTGTTCNPTNPCTEGQATNCDPNATCAVTGPSTYSCTCKTGYVGNGTTCALAQPCSVNNGGCDPNATCTDPDGTVVCTCNNGYLGNGYYCVNNMLCQQLQPCDANATCSDVPGSYTCACNPGYSGNGTSCTYINPCTNGTAKCDPNATCSSPSAGNYVCTCNVGYFGTGTSCVLKNACTDGTAQCDPNYGTCTPLSGEGYTCGCKAGYQMATSGSTTCTSIPYCENQTAGTSPAANCDPKATCQDTPGSFTCTCPSGYGTNNNGQTCLDSNECGDGTAKCDSLATCTNSLGSYTCTCPSGYTTSNAGQTCTSIPYCENQTAGMSPAADCDPVATCMDTPGSYTCSCPANYTTTNAGATCTPVNPCTNGTSMCAGQATCTYTGPGMATCSCDPGYAGNGMTCTSDCLTNNGGCSSNATCTIGSMGVVCTCNTGYVGNGTTCTVDPCGPQGTAMCDTTTTTCVTNSNGTATCQCLSGYQPIPGNTQSCASIDYCGTGMDQCAKGATCMDTPGSYSCTCPPGTTGDGFSCVCADIGTATCAGGQNVNTQSSAGAVTLSTNASFRFAWPGVGNAALAATMNSNAISSSSGVGSMHYLVSTGSGTSTDTMLANSPALLSTVQVNTTAGAQASAIWVDNPNTSNQNIGNAGYAALSSSGATFSDIQGGSGNIPTSIGDMFYGANGAEILFVGNVDQYAASNIGNLYWANGPAATQLGLKTLSQSVAFSASRTVAVAGINMVLNSSNVPLSGVGDLVAINMQTGKTVTLATGIQVMQPPMAMAPGTFVRRNFALSANGQLVAFVTTSGELDVISTTGTNKQRITGTAEAPALSADGSEVAYFDTINAYSSSTSTPSPIVVGPWTGPIYEKPVFAPDAKSFVYFTNVAIHDGGFLGTAWIAPTNGSLPPFQVSNLGVACTGSTPTADCQSTNYLPVLASSPCGNDYLFLDQLFASGAPSYNEGLGKLVHVNTTACSSAGMPLAMSYYNDSTGTAVSGVRYPDFIPLLGGASVAMIDQSFGAGFNGRPLGTPIIGSYTQGLAQISAGMTLANVTVSGSLLSSPLSTRVMLFASPSVSSTVDTSYTMLGALVTSDTTGNGHQLSGNVVYWNQLGAQGNPFMPDGRAIVVQVNPGSPVTGSVSLIPVQ